MVSVVQFHPQSSAAALEPIAEGVSGEGRSLIARALEFAEPLYAGQVLSTGEPVWPHALGLGASLAAVGIDPVHLGLVMVVNLGIGLLTPPVGLCLLVSCKIGKISISQAIPAMLPWFGICLAFLAGVTYLPVLFGWF